METDSDYFEQLKTGLEKAYSLSQQARQKGMDPEFKVEVKITRDVAARVEGIVGPKGIAEIIRNMESQGKNREDAAFEIARIIANGEIIKGSKEQLLEQAVRTGLGILTEGVLVAPTEGIAKVKIKNNPDGSDFVAVYYAGPIRSAGGTAVALSVLLVDIARRVAGVGDYRATDTQIERYVEEVNIYESRVAHLQYKPSEEEIRWIVQNCPICIDGEPTEEIEAGTFRNVPGVETNRIRGGIPLVICEGIAQKAGKVLKYTKKLKLGWDWLEKIIKITKKEDKIEIKSDDTYLDGLVAGRPVFSYPSAKGGFRLRYGKSKTNCLMAKNVHPATMALLENFLAFGTHMKIERPGKGCVIAPCEQLDPPVVKLNDGSVIKVKTYQEALKIKDSVAEILFLGDLLITFGDFYKSNHPLMPSAWCQEWFEKECKQKGVSVPANVNAKEAFEFSKVHNIPLHPDYTYNWHDLTIDQLNQLIELLINAKVNFENEEIKELTIDIKDKAGALRALEDLLIEYKAIGNGQISISNECAYALLTSLALLEGRELTKKKFEAVFDPGKKVLQVVNELAGIVIKAKAPTYIGARMGRPEKAKERKMEGSPNVLFPTGSQKNRSITKVYRTLKAKEGEKTTNLDLVRMRCTKCQALGFYKTCSVCKNECKNELICQKCNKIVESDMHCDNKTLAYDRRPINMVNLIEEAKKKLEIMPEDVKGVKGLSNIEKISERLEKGFLRAKNDVYVFRDGTSRFDATNSPLTHFTAKEIKTSIEKLREMGYQKDHLGNKIINNDQIIPLYAQDIIISKSGAEYFLRVANFIDDMLVNLYGMQAFYNIRAKEDLVGHLAVGLSPHTSAAVLCRIIGFTDAFVGYAHPFFHAAKRRNCFYPDTRIIIYKTHRKKNTKIVISSDEKVEGTLGDIVENIIRENPKNVKKLDDNTEKIEPDKFFFTYSLDPKTMHIVKRKIKCFIRVKPPAYWIRAVTASSREIIVTPDHNILYFEDKLKVVEAINLRTGMKIPSNLSYNSNETVARPGFVDLDEITKIEKIKDNKNAYCLDIETETNDLIEKNVLLENGIFCIRCDGDEDCIMLLLDTLINFSRHYLNEKRGGTMDAPLVLTPALDPKEIDDEAHAIEFVSEYPLEFYHATERFAMPSEIKIKSVKDVLGTPEQFESIPLTHPSGDINTGNLRTAYVQLESIPDKIGIQFKLQEKIRSVDKKNAAERLILGHFIPDLYGNLRSFSRQTFRCVNCNESYRRVPLAGKCLRCGGNLLLTINKGGIQKYLEISRKIVEDYELPGYIKQRLDLVDKEIKSIFEDEKIKQMGLADFI